MDKKPVMKKSLVIILVILAILFIAFVLFNFYLKGKDTPTITQGIYGKAQLITGDCSPTIGPDDHSSCMTIYYPRIIYVREPAWSELMSVEDGRYLEEKPRLIKRVISRMNGFYEIELPPGTYSIFVSDWGKEYCNLFGGRGEVCQVTIGNELKEYDIKINKSFE
jgi:hypothetical protein